jgi:hypothetical protein
MKIAEKTNEKANKISIAGLLLTILIALTINVPFAIWNWQQNNRAIDIANENLAITNMINNFNCSVSAAQSYGVLYSNSFSPYPNGSIESVTAYGQLSVTLEVVTPHYAYITIEIGNLTQIDQTENSYWMNPEMKNQTTVSCVFDEPFEDTIGSGLTQVNATLQLETTVYPDPQQLPPIGNTTRFPLGPLLLDAELYDLQSQKNFTKEFTEPIGIQITTPNL